MNFTRFIVLAVMTAHLNLAFATEVKSTCVFKVQDPAMQSFFRSQGIDVDNESGDFDVEFEVTCEAVAKKIEKFSKTEIHKTSTKLEIYNLYKGQKDVYHSETEVTQGGRLESAFVVPCNDTKASKQKLLESAAKYMVNLTCED